MTHLQEQRVQRIKGAEIIGHGLQYILSSSHLFLKYSTLILKMISPMIFVDALCVCLAIYLVKTYFGRRTRQGPSPPGPKPLPIIGNLLDMPASHEWFKFTEWAHTYGQPEFSVPSSHPQF